MKARVLLRRSNKLEYTFSGYQKLEYDKKLKMWMIVDKDGKEYYFSKDVFKVKTSWK